RHSQFRPVRREASIILVGQRVRPYLLDLVDPLRLKLFIRKGLRASHGGPSIDTAAAPVAVTVLHGQLLGQPQIQKPRSNPAVVEDLAIPVGSPLPRDDRLQ